MKTRARIMTVTAFGCLATSVFVGCESYQNGKTETKTTRVEETPTAKTTTETKTERKVEDLPR